jgi:hypothetical protein
VGFIVGLFYKIFGAYHRQGDDFMSYITINGNVTIIVNNNAKMDTPQVSVAKDRFIDILYRKRDWDKFNGREGWTRMRYLYDMKRYNDLLMYLYALPFNKTRDEAIACVNTIIGKNNNNKNKKHRKHKKHR